jgi:predicted lipoprotein with Yx(FWY)xxD motif
MKSRFALGIAVASFAVLGLTACSAGTSSAAAPTTPAAAVTTKAAVTTSTATTSAASGSSLMVAQSSLGSIVVDGVGNVVYQFDSDTNGSGKSSCTGGCLAKWPPVHGGAGAPTLKGITGAVSTITGTDGKPQLTLNGWPLYYFAGDSKPGDTNGEAVGSSWWVLNPAGEPVHK